jgi:N-acetyltransferase
MPQRSARLRMMSERVQPALVVGDLVGRHVTLERMRIDHVDAIATAGSGDRSTFGFTGVPDGLEQAAEYVTGLVNDAERSRCAPFVQRRVADGVIVGCTRYMSPAWPLGRRDPDEVEVGGTWLAADAQRSPINTEAKLLLLTNAFDAWGARRVAICTDARNDRSRRAIERLGATFEGVLRQHRASTAAGEAGTLRDTAIYSIIAAEWPGIKGALESRLASPPAG